jgi:hypothetical protein
MSIDALVSRLSGVRMTGLSKGIALCPAHPDRSPSLSFREIDDGRVLIKCFGGCGALDVLDALGLSWSVLFPESGHQNAPPSKSKIPAGDLLAIVDHEITVAVLILQEIVTQRTVKDSQVQRLLTAAARVSTARLIANPAKAENPT